MSVPLVQTIARALAEAGISALRFNFRGVGASEGTFDNGRGEVDDVAGALNWLGAQPEVDQERLALVGYSFGAVMALFQAARTELPRVLVLIGLPLGWKLSIPTIGCPSCLLVVGDKDQFCPLPDLHTLSHEMEGDVKVHVVAGADHFLFGQESEVASIVVDYLQETLSPVVDR
jgi:alpha/beta superfamily hydrolase